MNEGEEHILQERIRIAELVAKFRKEKGLSTYQLAELTGLRQPHISRLEKGKMNMSIDTLNKIAAALGVTVEFLEKSN
ncbi:MAG: helix-turn-helix domain-containing protein [Tannerella sp.]|jgi:transcriptional regulator with XRE-family HTH domain|nr:helix-turn-helix domain-containing protein [Tannerella sp.]